MDERTLNIAFAYAKLYKGHTIDTEKHVITFPFKSGITERDIPKIMKSGCIGKWYSDNGFNVEFTMKDVEYKIDVGSIHKTSYLRNRLVATITW